MGILNSKVFTLLKLNFIFWPIFVNAIYIFRAFDEKDFVFKSELNFVKVVSQYLLRVQESLSDLLCSKCCMFKYKVSDLFCVDKYFEVIFLNLIAVCVCGNNFLSKYVSILLTETAIFLGIITSSHYPDNRPSG